MVHYCGSLTIVSPQKRLQAETEKNAAEKLAYDSWKQERDQIDNARIARYNTKAKEWDVEKEELVTTTTTTAFHYSGGTHYLT